MICTKCKKNKSEDEFSFRDKEKFILRSECKKCQSLYHKEYYKLSPIRKKALRDRQSQYRQEVKVFISNYLMNHPCIDCGESDVTCLDFDHVRGIKFEEIADLSHRGVSLDRIKKEIDKCEVRCANCHRKVTHKRRIEKGNVAYVVIAPV